MNNLLDWIRTWGHWLTFLLLETISLVLLLRFNAYQGSVWFTQANAVTGSVLEWQHRMIVYTHLVEVNRQLTEVNQDLQSEVDVLRHRLQELEHDSSQTERALAERLAGIRRIPAKVVANSVRDKDNLITINRGEADGVRTEMGVVCGTGIVGIVSQTGRHYSIVLPILNSHSSISCRLKKTEYFGYLKWEGGSPLRAFIDDIPNHATVEKGEMVETSGFSSVFPPGIFIGKVRRVLISDDGLSYKLEIGLSTDFARLTDVSVIDWKAPERADANNQPEDSTLSNP